MPRKAKHINEILYEVLGNKNIDNLKNVTLVRVGTTFRLSILPQKWKRVNEKYESLLLALLANG